MCMGATADVLDLPCDAVRVIGDRHITKFHRDLTSKTYKVNVTFNVLIQSRY